ncbi:MAG: serine/threonine-protein phosphatase, partial [Phycisphaeraceae bacterium]|nr:serine/threonine-protein phosphatase [Phycisphaeraceae bacterium]
MTINLDISHRQYNKHGEELCGDTVLVRHTGERSIIVLSDGLGSGVKASILSTLTAQILLTMLSRDAALDDVLDTVIGTLPVCQVRHIAYATFTVVEVHRDSGQFRVVNFDNPPVLYFRGGRPAAVTRQTRQIRDKQIQMMEGQLRRGDFLGLLTDGTPHAGLGNTLNFGWGWDNIAQFVQQTLMTSARTAGEVTRRVMDKTWTLYDQKPGDDATFVAIWVRDRRRAMIFTGPPLSQADDPVVVQRLLGYEGRKIVCGGASGNLVAR